MGGIVTAFRTLTILPIPGVDARSPASALYWFPAVGLVIGCMQFGAAAAASFLCLDRWPELAALAAVGTGVLLTRGFHLDGLSDWADSFGSIADRDRMLAIMKDSRVGVFGVLALTLQLLSKWILITQFMEMNAPGWLIAAGIISRAMQVEMASSAPYARPEGGLGLAFVSGSNRRHRITALVFSLFITVCSFGAAGLAVFLAGLVVCRMMVRSSRRRLGGVTGDLLGACSEWVETAVLLTAALISLHSR